MSFLCVKHKAKQFHSCWMFWLLGKTNKIFSCEKAEPEAVKGEFHWKIFSKIKFKSIFFLSAKNFNQMHFYCFEILPFFSIFEKFIDERYLFNMFYAVFLWSNIKGIVTFTNWTLGYFLTYSAGDEIFVCCLAENIFQLNFLVFYNICMDKLWKSVSIATTQKFRLKNWLHTSYKNQWALIYRSVN